MLKNKNKKKKGFTLIELVIVLAVLAIIALIAIPNFAKVRQNSKAKADKATMETIENVTTMAIANEEIKTGEAFTFSIKVDSTKNKDESGRITLGGTTTSIVKQEDFRLALREVEAPQADNQDTYEVSVTDTGVVTADYEEKPTSET